MSDDASEENDVPPPWPADPAAIRSLDDSLAAAARIGRRLSAIRLATFIGVPLGLVLLRISTPFAIAVSAASLAGFMAALVRHQRLAERRTRLETRRTVLREILGRQTTRRRERPLPQLAASGHPLDRGERVFAPEPESFALDAGVVADLGILDGPRSLYGFLDVSSTVFGARRLRRWLTHLLTRIDAIRARQEAVRAAASQPSLRAALLEDLLALRQHELTPLAGALAAPPVFLRRRLLLVTAHILGTAAPSVLVLAFIWTPLIAAALLLAIVNMAVIGLHVRRSNPLRDRLLLFLPAIAALERVGRRLAGAELGGEVWREITATLATAEPALRRLQRLLGVLELHEYGVLSELLNVFTLWELRVLPVAERIFLENRQLLERSLGCLGDVEAILSLAGPLAEQERFSMPEPIASDRPRIDAGELGHPLIEADRVVTNALKLGDGANVWIITGSNMAGKSTFLKAAGTNLVLAAAGGPVCASFFRWTPVELHSDVNVRDSLDDGKSYFQVEVERVREVIRAAERTPHVLAIFDELFRGTNSRERLAISRALLKHLRSRGILLLVATHDLALTRLAEEEAEAGMRNLHLRETVHGHTMRFDYRLHEGPARTRNAIRVLQASGYPEGVITAAAAEAGATGVAEAHDTPATDGGDSAT